ncbi:DNA topoisomerase 2-binding protein 1 [Anoplophora glabripennis]|nr:DNA topoisomerase 2-binding protein 1 [Anoplophora glabripennis]
MENIRLIFVLPEKYCNEQEVSEIMKQAYETCKQNIKTDVSWVKESDFDSITINKTDFIIFEDFKGQVFENLKETKCVRILGPWATSICLVEGKPIPNFPWPIYNVAMYKCIVTCSNLSKIKKMEIKEKVQLMGGCYIDTLVEKVTHLVTDSPKSEKYLAAAEIGVKLMCSSWIEAVWEASQSSNIHANDEEFEEHKCLPFQNLNISSTGLTDVKRKEIEKLVNKYGGKYSARLKLTEADVLLCAGLDVSVSEKYKAARTRPNIRCVDVSWLTESIKKGYALSHTDFQIKKATSTPNKSDNLLNPNFSVLSAISMVNVCDKTVDATINANSSKCFSSPGIKVGPSKRKGDLREDYGQIVDKLDIKKAKKAGHYLDGYSIYITGFGPEHTEKLCKILNLSGATRYDQFSDRVTHVIVGDPNYHEVKVIKGKGSPCLLVSVQWLLDSIESEEPVNEEKYLLSTSDVDKSEFSSPLSRKGLNLLRTNKTIIEVDEEKLENSLRNVDNAEQNIIQQYLKSTAVEEDDDTLVRLLKNADNFPDFSNKVQEPPSAMPQFRPSETSTQETTTMSPQDEQTESKSQIFFEGLKFLVLGFVEDQLEHIKELIEAFCGTLVPKGYKGIPDFIVVPTFNSSEIRHTAREVVNELFITECASQEHLLSNICYYHRPFDLPDTRPLENCVIAISGYGSYERDFLKRLIPMLGGHHQESFSRVTSEVKGVVASTHLICDKDSGKKYQGAVKWKLPAVTKDWLLECARTGSRVPESDYLVGGVVPSKNTSIMRKTEAKTPNPKPSASNTPLSSRRQNDQETIQATPSVDAENAQQSMSNLSCLAKFNTPTNISMQSNVTPEVSATTGKVRPSSSKTSRVLTPLNQILRRQIDFNGSPDLGNVFSQATPVNKIVKQYRESNSELTPSRESPQRFPWMGIKTPETPLEACMVDNPSPQLRKHCELWLKQFPDCDMPPQRRLSTPLSDIKRKLWNKILTRGEYPPAESNLEQDEHGNDAEEMDVEEPKELPAGEDSPQYKLIHSRLQQMEEMLSASGGGRRQSRNFQSTIPIPEGNKEYKDSQACTVGWDFQEQEVAPKPMKIFILTGVGESDRSKMVEELESLGATVSDLSNYDPTGSHLLCPKPARNEKILSCMAAGKWILHTSYLEKSLEAGHFLDEEEFEFGNPKSAGKLVVKFEKDTELRMKYMHWWRKEVSRRGYGAFNDMRAIVVAQKKDSIIRVIEAGGGLVIDVSPPFEETVHATHCFLEQRSVRDYTDYIPLAQQGIYLLNTVYISDYLHQPNRDVRECILPYFAKYYSRS